MTGRYFITATLVLLIHSAELAGACPLLDPVTDFESQFRQVRTIEGLSKPIVSTGQFRVEDGRRIVWKTESPFPGVVIVDEDGISVDGKRQESSQLKYLSRILLKLHSGRFDQLEDDFTVSCKETEKGDFEVKAEPASRVMKRVLKSFSLRGTETPSQIRYRDSRGDLTQIYFSSKSKLGS